MLALALSSKENCARVQCTASQSCERDCRLLDLLKALIFSRNQRADCHRRGRILGESTEKLAHHNKQKTPEIHDSFKTTGRQQKSAAQTNKDYTVDAESCLADN